MKPVKVIFYSSRGYVEEAFKSLNHDKNFEFIFVDSRINEQNTILANGCDVVCCFVNDNLNAQCLKQLKSYGCKLIAMRCAGYNNIDLSAAKELELPIVRVPEYSPYAVAEYAMAMLLTLNRKTHKAYNRIRDLNFDIDGLRGFDLNGKTIGIIGTGRIGKIFIKICRGFGLNVLAYDVYPDKEAETSIGFKYVDLSTLYQESDIICLWCPLTQQTQHIINEETLKQMKDGVFLINTSRGGLLNTLDVIKYLKNGKIAYLALDVYEEEENYFFEDLSKTATLNDDVLLRLLNFNNVLITSHQAFFTKEAVDKIASLTLENITQYIKNNILQNQVI